MDKSKQLSILQAEGFETPAYTVVKGTELSDEFLTTILSDFKTGSNYALDGIVLDIDKENVRSRLGLKNKNPEYAKKFKLNSDRAVATVKQVHWNISKLGYLKPRVEIEPVELVGVTITYATGFNAKFIRDNGIGPNAIIQITRSGDVIPFIEKVITSTIPSLPSVEEYGEMYWSDNNVDLILKNDTDEAKLRRIIEFFGSLEVPQLKRGNLERLYEEGFNTTASIIKASEHDIKRIVGEANGVKIYQGLKEKLTDIPLWLLVGSSQMFDRGIGKKRMKKLEDTYGYFLDLSISEIKAVEGFEDKTAQAVFDGFIKVKVFLKEIEGFYTLKTEPIISIEKIDLVVCFTGIRDKNLQDKIEALGGTISSGVNNKLTHLVVKDLNSTSSKMKKAKELGITIITIEDAQKLWGR